MKEIKLNMDEQKQKATAASAPPQHSSKQPKQSKRYDEEIATVEKIPEKIYQKTPGTTLLQKLTTISFMVICLLICIFAIKTLGHVRTMAELKIPEDAVVEDVAVEEPTEPEENVEYIEAVTYSPTEAATKALAEADNGKDWLSAITSPHTWTFKSDYEYSGARIHCVWLCTDDATGDLLAFRVAEYNAGTDEFKNATIYVTAVGGEHFAVD